MRNYLIILILIIISSFVGIIIGIIYYNNFMVVDIQEIKTNIVVMKGIGIDTNSSALTFGGVSPSGSSRREVYITQNLIDKAKIKIKKYGEFSEWISISDNNFYLDKNETRTVIFTATVPLDAEMRKFEGKIIIITQKPII